MPDTGLLLGVALIALLPFAACGGEPGLSGTWEDETGVTSLEFQPDGLTPNPGLVGAPFHHAFAVLSTLNGEVLFVSNPEPLSLVP